MISAMGDAEGKPKGGFVLLDEDFKVLCSPDWPEPCEIRASMVTAIAALYVHR